jgi:hypothetical protein
VHPSCQTLERIGASTNHFAEDRTIQLAPQGRLLQGRQGWSLCALGSSGRDLCIRRRLPGFTRDQSDQRHNLNCSEGRSRWPRAGRNRFLSWSAEPTCGWHSTSVFTNVASSKSSSGGLYGGSYMGLLALCRFTNYWPAIPRRNDHAHVHRRRNSIRCCTLCALQAKSTKQECALTLPSRGCPKGCAFWSPLMSNVRRRRNAHRRATTKGQA